MYSLPWPNTKDQLCQALSFPSFALTIPSGSRISYLQGGSHRPPSLLTLFPLPLTQQNSSEPSQLEGLRCLDESNTAPTAKEVKVKGFSGYNAT